MELRNFENIGAKLGLAGLEKPVLIGLTAIMVMVAVFAGRIVIDAATATEITLEHEQEESAQATDESSATQPAATVYVHISGAVKEPGLVMLPEGSRVADAVEAAEGFTKKADEDSINLARIVNDGEHIVVYETGMDNVQDQGNPPVDADSGNEDTYVNINTATEQELQALPGIGPATAAKIVDYRTINGPFSKTEDLTNVSGIGDKKYESIADKICV